MIQARSSPPGVGLVTAVLLSALTAATHAGSDYAIHWHAIHAGGISHASGSDYSLSGTIGQPAPGFSEGDDYTLHAGFWVAAPLQSERIFDNGFEGE